MFKPRFKLIMLRVMCKCLSNQIYKIDAGVANYINLCVKIKFTRDVHDVEVGVAGLLIAVLWDGIGDNDGREESVSSARKYLSSSS